VLNQWRPRASAAQNQVRGDGTALPPGLEHIGEVASWVATDLLERGVQRLIPDRHAITEHSKLHEKRAFHSKAPSRRTPGDDEADAKESDGAEEKGQEPDLCRESDDHTDCGDTKTERNPATPRPAKRRRDILLVLDQRDGAAS
jgi:hypothetical protein